jgi:hypothetical protein
MLCRGPKRPPSACWNLHRRRLGPLEVSYGISAIHLPIIGHWLRKKATGATSLWAIADGEAKRFRTYVADDDRLSCALAESRSRSRELSSSRLSVIERILIERLGHRGDGIADSSDGPIYIPGTLPGEIVEVDAAPGHPDRRRLLNVEKSSAHRIEPICSILEFAAAAPCNI